MLLSEGQMSDYKGAALMLATLPHARQLLGQVRQEQVLLVELSAQRHALAHIGVGANHQRRLAFGGPAHHLAARANPHPAPIAVPNSGVHNVA